MSLHDTALFAPSLTATLSRDIAVAWAQDQGMLVLGVGDGRLISYGLAADGTLQAMRAPVLVDPALATVDRLDYLPDAVGGGVLALAGGGLYQMDAGAGLTQLGGLDDQDLALSLVQGAGGVMLTRATPDGVESAWVGTGGGLASLDSVGAAEGFGVATPTAVETIAAHGAQFTILGAAGSQSLSVLELQGDGAFQIRDHLIDSRFSRFADLQDIAVTQVAGQVFVVAGGSDDGLSLLTLLPDGRLIYLDSIASTDGARLDGITRLTAVHAQDALQIFAATQGDAGLAHLSVPMGNIGQVLRGTGALVAGAGDDLLVAEGAAATLTGGAGDDILVAGPAGSTLTGGVGADLFVMQSGGGVVRITDFDLSQDRLDLSDYTLLRNPDQLSVTRVTGGARITFRDEVLLIDSHDGASFGQEDLFGFAFEGPDRIPLFLFESAPPPDPAPVPDPPPPADGANLLSVRAQEANPLLADADIRFTPAGGDTVTFRADGAGRFDLGPIAGETGHLQILRSYSTGDPAFGVDDALNILRIAVGLEPGFGPTTATDRIAADFDRDGVASVSDALDVLRLGIGLPVDTAPEWLFLDPQADLAAVVTGGMPLPDGVNLTVPLDGALEFLVTAILPGNLDGVL